MTHYCLQCEKSKIEASLQQNASDSAARLSEAEQSQSQILQDKQVSSTAQQHLYREPGRTLPESASFNSYLLLFGRI